MGRWAYSGSASKRSCSGNVSPSSPRSVRGVPLPQRNTSKVRPCGCGHHVPKRRSPTPLLVEGSRSIGHCAGWPLPGHLLRSPAGWCGGVGWPGEADVMAPHTGHLPLLLLREVFTNRRSKIVRGGPGALGALAARDARRDRRWGVLLAEGSRLPDPEDVCASAPAAARPPAARARLVGGQARGGAVGAHARHGSATEGRADAPTRCHWSPAGSAHGSTTG